MEKAAPTRRARPYMVAMMLGTALTAISPAPVQARGVAEATPAVGDLSRYCTACWRNARLPVDTWNDCTQEVLCRLLQRVPQEDWSRTLSVENEEHRELVRAIDAVKKRTQRQKKWSSQPLDLVPDGRESRDRDLEEWRASVRNASRDLLTARQQTIVQLSLEGWSVHDISRELDTPPERVSDEKYKAIRKLHAHLASDA